MPKAIRIDGVIGQGQGEISAEHVRAMLPEDGVEPIKVSIHSEGGSVFEGFAIYDMFASYGGPKSIAIESTAFSIASFIAMAFDEIEMSPNAYLMLHNPRVGTEGDDEELAAQAGMIGKLKANMVDAYAARSGKTADEITAILKAETYMNASDAVANGFADRITNKPVSGRPLAHMEAMPHGVVVALLGASSGGEEREPTKESAMSDSQPVAATVQEIKSAFPAAKSDFIVRCIEKQMPIASVAAAAAEELMAENEMLMAKVAAMEEEMAKAKAMEEEEAAAKAKAMEEEEVEEMAKARRRGVAPVAQARSGKPSATAQWREVVEACVTRCNGDRPKAIKLANRQNPGLREAYLAEVNS